jgi:hypothetical protein
MGGDFRQVLPVVKKGTRSSIVGACLKRHALWRSVKQLKLRKNMRAARLSGPGRLEQQRWADHLLDIGNGIVDSPMQVPDSVLAPTSDPQDLIDSTFGDMINNPARITPSALGEAIITTPLNKDAAMINLLAMDKFPGSPTVYLSGDHP